MTKKKAKSTKKENSETLKDAPTFEIPNFDEVPGRSRIVSSEEKLTVSTPYTDHKGERQEATVILEIDCSSGKYNILPNNGMDAFKFKDTSWKDANRWKAIANAIEDAVDFAEKKLNKEKGE